MAAVAAGVDGVDATAMAGHRAPAAAAAAARGGTLL